MKHRRVILSLALLAGMVGFAPKKAKGALPASTTTWEVQPTNGVDTNGGCFIAGATGTDLTYPTSSPVAYTDLVAATTTTIASAATPFSAASVGNCLHIASGTGWTTGWFQIVSVSVVTATVDRAIATMGSTGGTGTLGGALKTLIAAEAQMAANHQAWMKAEATQTMGRLDINFASTGFAAITGYTTTRGDNGSVTLQMTASDYFVVMNTGSQNVVFKNFILDCNSTCNGDGLFFQGCCQTAYNIQIKGMGAHIGLEMASTRNLCAFCSVTGVTSGITPISILDDVCFYCVAYSNTSTVSAILLGSGGGGASGPACIRCIAANNTSTSSAYNINQSGGPSMLLNSVAVNDGGDCLVISNAANQFPVMVLNNIFVSCAGFGINHSGSTLPPGGEIFNFNAIYNTGSGSYSGLTAGPNDVALSGNPFVNSASNNFALNNTAGQGVAAKAVGAAGALAVGGTGYIDLGALQSQAAAAAVTVGVPIQ